ncbi:Spx/MgsR family RNA polymerase-binding regulatory protein [Parvibaculum sp.]|uniref:Spx/MgsR family RNA polymerase-binding regulatory protein n=1 Tax=Parvibaculum sp. TaxID=2024848 RepID=UPI002C4CEC45|nr:Spx/MgsR family RNA polymerase-binding regulatory protein [Parvibaculum sp.]HUD50700.1 Spx/MgsR family RNA polymerase-binding regulatory protein [Parvibaculum sp.]
MITVYGLKNCDTCRKALAWLGEQKIAHRFHDIRADGISREDVARFVKAVGAEKLVNKASTTWRGLPDAEKDVSTEAKVVTLLAANPTLIKRPVFENGKSVVSGFRDAEKAAIKAMAK